MTELDIAALVRALAEQQTALLAAHAESMRVQRVLIERLTNTGPVADPPECAPSETSGKPGAVIENELANNTKAPETPGAVADLVQGQSADAIATSAEPEAVVAEAARATEDVSGNPPVLQVVSSTGPGRSDRYYRSATRPQLAPSSVNPQQLNVLRAIHSIGDLGHLLLMFGPHAGETLGQIAQNDLEYLRGLARSAHRADVRAAAARLVAAVPSDPPVDRKPSSHRSRRGR